MCLERDIKQGSLNPRGAGYSHSALRGVGALCDITRGCADRIEIPIVGRKGNFASQGTFNLSNETDLPFFLLY